MFPFNYEALEHRGITEFTTNTPSTRMISTKCQMVPSLFGLAPPKGSISKEQTMKTNIYYSPENQAVLYKSFPNSTDSNPSDLSKTICVMIAAFGEVGYVTSSINYERHLSICFWNGLKTPTRGGSWCRKTSFLENGGWKTSFLFGMASWRVLC